MVSRDEGGIMMVMEHSELQDLLKTVICRELAIMDGITSETEFNKYSMNLVASNDEVIRLIDKCSDFQWRKMTETQVAKDNQDCLKQAIDMTMERLVTWLPKSWDGLVKDLRYEMKVAYDKYLNLKKKYGNQGNELIERHQGNQEDELIKDAIAEDIQKYAKYGINIGLQCVRNCHSRQRWLRRIAKEFEMFARKLAVLDVRNENDLTSLADDVSYFNKCLLEYGNDGKDDGPAQVLLKVYLIMLQKEDVFSAIEMKRKEIGFEGEFDSLTQLQQIEVYKGIIDEFDRGYISNVQFIDFIYDKGSMTETFPYWVQAIIWLFNISFSGWLRRLSHMRDWELPDFLGENTG